MSQNVLLKIPGSYFQVNSNYEFSYFRISLEWTNKTIFKTVQILILGCSINIFINFLPLGMSQTKTSTRQEAMENVGSLWCQNGKGEASSM